MSVLITGEYTRTYPDDEATRLVGLSLGPHGAVEFDWDSRSVDALYPHTTREWVDEEER